MNFIAYLVAGLSIAAAPAKAADAQQDTTSAAPSAQGSDAYRAKAADTHATTERHWDPSHVEAKERTTARNDTNAGARSADDQCKAAASKKRRNETIEEHRKIEKRSDGSTHSEMEKKRVHDDGSGDVIDDEKTVTDSKPNDQGGRDISREVTREHDAPGSAHDRKTHVKEKIEKDANGKIIKREKSE